MKPANENTRATRMTKIMGSLPLCSPDCSSHGLYVPLSYKMLGINNLAIKQFQQSSFYLGLSTVHFIYPVSTFPRIISSIQLPIISSVLYIYPASPLALNQ